MTWRVRRAVCACEPFDLRRHPPSVGERLGPYAQKGQSLIRERFGFALVEIANRRQANVVVFGSGKLGQSAEMTSPHSAATNDRYADQIRHLSIP